MGFLKEGFSNCLPELVTTAVFLISASRVAGIIGMSHQYLAENFFKGLTFSVPVGPVTDFLVFCPVLDSVGACSAFYSKNLISEIS
jgi:hypothetical protein